MKSSTIIWSFVALVGAAAYFGLLLPALVSAKDDISVLGGIGLMSLPLLLGALLINNRINKGKKG